MNTEIESGVLDWAGALLGIAMLIMALDVLVAGGGWVQTADAQTSQDSAISYKSGEVTAIGETTIQIDKQDYALLSDAVITDEEGKPRDRKELVPGTFVQFHVSARRGGIDQIIMILPK
jgi:hypothetical protein